MTLLLIFSIKLFSQESKFSIELNYPIPIDKNFIGKNYNGIIDVGANYRMANLPPLNLGVLVNNQNNRFQNFKVTAYVIQPRIFGALDIKSIDKFHPSVGLGYTIMVFNTSGTNNGFDVSNARDPQSGFNFNFGLAYDITEKLFAQVQ